jgi:transposase-like protein
MVASMTALQNEVFQDEPEARAWLETHRWPGGLVCPHCGVENEATLIEGKKRAHRDGLYMCNACRRQFTVTMGTIFERSHVPLHKWLFAAFMLCASKKGISSHQRCGLELQGRRRRLLRSRHDFAQADRRQRRPRPGDHIPNDV